MSQSTRESNQVCGYQAYVNLLSLVLRPETRMDKIDDYLIGRTGELSTQDWLDEDEEEIAILDQLIDALVSFPPNSLGVLEGLLPNRPYSLFTLFALHGDRCLIYTLASLTHLGVADFDSRQFNTLSEEVKLILRSIKTDQSLRRPLRIPRDIRRRIQETRQKILNQQEHNHQKAGRTRTDSLEPDAYQHPRNQTGAWIGEYFVEDYEDREDAQRRQPSGMPMTNDDSRIQAGPSSTNTPQKPTVADRPNGHQDKRAKLASLAVQRVTTTPPPLPPPPVPPASVPETLPLENQNSPFVYVQVSGLPVEATQQSILFFFQHGADIFKVARTLNQRLDALGRNLRKFNPSVTQAYQTKGSSGKGERVRRFEVRDEDIKIEPDGDQLETRSVLVRFRRPTSPLDDQQHTPWNAFIEEFDRKKFFRFDPLCTPLSCRLSPSF